MANVSDFSRRLKSVKTAQEALKESEDHYRSLFDNMLNGYAYCEMLFEGDKPKDFIFLNVNSAFEALTLLENVIGKKVSEVIPGIRESDSELFEIYGQVARTGVPERFETYVEALGMWFSVSVYSPQKEHFVAVFDVITERKRAEERLKEYEKVVEGLEEMIAVVDRDYRYLIANRAFLNHRDMERGQVVGRLVSEILGKEVFEQVVKKQLDECFEGNVIKYEMKHNYPKLRDRDLFISYFPIAGPAGVDRVACVLQDITERKRAEDETLRLHAAIRQERDTLSALVSSIPDEVWFADAQKKFTLANPSALREFVLGPDSDIDIEMFAASLEVFRPDGSSRPVEEAPPLRSLKGEVVRNLEETVRVPASGELRHRQVNSSPVRGVDGNIIGSVSVVRDITERKQMEEELRRSRDELELRVRERTAELESANEKLRLVPSILIEAQENERKRLAGDLHDSIGQTLAALKFRIEHVIASLEKRESKQALQLLQEFVPILQHSIDETRAIYMGLKPMILSDFGLLATLEWYRLELLKLYPNQHIELETSIGEEDIPEELRTTIFRIAQEAINNTFKHGKSEWVDVRLAGNNEAIELEISDDGIGMDLDYIMESSTAKSLGLIGMRERTELTGGEFTIKSAPNEGTTIKAVWRSHSKNSSLKRPPVS